MLVEEKLLSFLEEKGNGQYIKTNDFLKSFYPLPKGNEQPKWANQQEMKILRNWLSKLHSESKITCNQGRHNTLGRPYYEGVNQVQKFYHLGNLALELRLGLDDASK